MSDILNYMPPPFYNSESEMESTAFKFLDLLIPMYPYLLEFDHAEIIRQYIIESKIENDREIIEVRDLIEHLLLDEGFAVIPKDSNLLLKLTPEGRKLKRSKTLKKYYNMRERWPERNPVLFQIILAVATGAISLFVGISISLLDRSKKELEYKEVLHQVQAANGRIDSLKKSLPYPKMIPDSTGK